MKLGVSTMNEIIIDTTCSEEDYIAFNFYTLNKYYKSKLLIVMMLILGVLMVITGLFIEELFILIALGVGLLVFSLVYIPILKRNIKKMYKASPLMKQQSTLTVDNEKLIEVSEVSQSTLTWDKILQIGESDKYIYIFISKIQAYIIKKSKLREEELSNLKLFIPKDMKRL
jgi:hypothetical protein